MSYETLEFEVADGVATVTLNRPQALNSFNTTMHGELRDALDRVERDANVKTLLLTGNGRGFCAGQDLSDRAVNDASSAVDLGHSIENYYNPLIRRLRKLPMPVVCAVNGVAAGAGANIALACDIVLAARSAKFIQAFCKIGLIPDSGGTWILPRLVGQARASALALTGEAVGADDAVGMGMIWRAVDDENLRDEAQKLCLHFATQPARGLAAIKRTLQASWGNDLDTQLDLERDTQRDLGFSADYREGVAAFLQKRAPAFATRREDVP